MTIDFFSVYELLRKVKWEVERQLGERQINFRGNGFINLIDVGSAGWLPRPWSDRNNTRKIAHLLRFEPQEKSRVSKNVITVDEALWEKQCQKDFFFFSGRGGGASLYEQNYEYVQENFENLVKRGSHKLAETWFQRSEVYKTVKINCRSLDDVVRSLSLPFDFHFLKIDAQGAEFPILRGAETLLRDSLVGLHLELFEIPLFKDIVLLPDVKAYLQGQGFECVLEYPPHGTFHSQRDCVFLKKSRRQDLIFQTLQAIYGLY